MKTERDISKNLVDELDSASKQLKKESEGEVLRLPGEYMKIVYSERGPETPFETAPAAKKDLKAYSADACGAFSLEKFCSAGSLRYTHEDASGWLGYLGRFHTCNFWYKDDGVRVWAYYEDYDNWQDTYGMDAVMAVYHSGHGGMTGDGKFCAPLGYPWGGLGCTAWSDKMQLGNEQVRYIFWSTCYSCRVSDGHSPRRTWHPANYGFRMLFGYETVSYDNPNYGSAFWKHWNKGKSLSTAFLDASWYDISHHQAPAVVACGATADEAKNRLFNERFLSWDSVSKAWYYWRWYYAASTAIGARKLNLEVPSEVLVAELQPRVVDGGYVSSVLSKHNLGIGLPKEVQASPDGIFSIKYGDMRAAFEGDGSYEIQFAKPNRDNTDQISMREAKNIAEGFAQQHGLDREGLTFDRIMLSNEAGGEADSDQIEGPFTTETTVQFTQEINGIPVLLPGKGGVSVTVDNDGNVTELKNSTRRIERLTDRLKNAPPAPVEEAAKDVSDPERLLADAWQKNMADWIVRGRMPLQYTVVPGTYEIGYAIKGNRAVLMARNDVEIDCGGGYLKRYSIEVPLFE